MTDRKLPDEYIEKLIIKGMMTDPNYTASLSTAFKKDYFDSEIVADIWKLITDHFKQYNNLPDKEIIKQSISEDKKEDVTELFNDIGSIEYNISKNYDHLFDETNYYLKEKAFKDALMKGVDLVQSGKNPLEFKDTIEEALAKDLKIDLGVNYWKELNSRLKRVLSQRDVKIPSYFGQLDEFINGGFPTYTLSVFLARVHGFKCVGYNTEILIKNKNSSCVSTNIGDFFQSFNNKSYLKLYSTNMRTTIKDNDYEVWTDDGWKNIDYIHQTHKEKKYFVLFESGISIECADRHAFITINNETKLTKDLNIGDEILSENGYDIVFDVLDSGEKDYFYDFTLNEHHKYYTNGILSHNSNFLVNMASRQVLNGYNPLIISLEMSEDSICQRFDSIYSGLNINRIYMDKTTSHKMVSSLKNIKENNSLGQLIIKEFPTGAATLQDFDTLIRELNYRGFFPSCIICDYLQLIKGTGNNEKRYEELKSISEGLRAMSLKHKAPVISVGQMNALGMVTSFDEIDFNMTAGSNVDIPATADFMSIFGREDDKLTYESELHYKIVKNRLGGRVGERGKMYFDKSSLKMYDQTELDKWIEAAKISGDDRKPKRG